MWLLKQRNAIQRHVHLSEIKDHCRESLNREETGDVPDIAATKAYIHTYINTYNLPMLRTTMTLDLFLAIGPKEQGKGNYSPTLCQPVTIYCLPASVNTSAMHPVIRGYNN